MLLFGGFSGRFGGYGYGFGHGGISVLGIVLIVLVVLLLIGPDLIARTVCRMRMIHRVRRTHRLAGPDTQQERTVEMKSILITAFAICFAAAGADRAVGRRRTQGTRRRAWRAGRTA